jgi:hypothetical protein
MNAIITIQDEYKDCTSNIVIDIDKLKALTIEDVKNDADYFKDAQLYVKIIEQEYYRLQNNKGKEWGDEGYLRLEDMEEIEEPKGWGVLLKAEVELPVMVDFTDVICYRETRY